MNMGFELMQTLWNLLALQLIHLFNSVIEHHSCKRKIKFRPKFSIILRNRVEIHYKYILLDKPKNHWANLLNKGPNAISFLWLNVNFRKSIGRVFTWNFPRIIRTRLHLLKIILTRIYIRIYKISYCGFNYTKLNSEVHDLHEVFNQWLMTVDFWNKNPVFLLSICIAPYKFDVANWPNSQLKQTF